MDPGSDPAANSGADLDADRGSDLGAVADELYALPVEDFVRVRDERVKQARAAKDRALAAAIGELRKPSVGAGVVNLLVHERPDLVDQLSELGEALRAAQETLSGAELRALSAQRHRVVASVVTEARKLAGAAGVKVSDQVSRELEATFDAALTNPDAAAAVRSGRLTGTLSYAGLGTLTTGTATAPAPRPPAKPTAPAEPAPPDPDADRKRAEAEAERAQKARRAAEQAVQEAEREAESADADRAGAAAYADQAELDRDDAQQQVADLTAQLERAQADAVAATNRVREAHRARSRAEHRAEEAHRRLDRTRGALEQLG